MAEADGPVATRALVPAKRPALKDNNGIATRLQFFDKLAHKKQGKPESDEPPIKPSTAVEPAPELESSTPAVPAAPVETAAGVELAPESAEPTPATPAPPIDPAPESEEPEEPEAQPEEPTEPEDSKLSKLAKFMKMVPTGN